MTITLVIIGIVTLAAAGVVGFVHSSPVERVLRRLEVETFLPVDSLTEAERGAVDELLRQSVVVVISVGSESCVMLRHLRAGAR